MREGLRHNYWRLGLTSGLLFITVTILHAQAPLLPDPETMSKLANRDSLLVSVYVLGVVNVGVMSFAWKQFGVVQDLTKALTNLTSQLNTRPCILASPQPKNPNLLADA